MGGCASKNKIKSSKRRAKEPDSGKKDKDKVPNPAPSSQSLPSSTGFTVNRENSNNLADDKELSIDSDIQILAKEQDGLSAVRHRPIPHTVVPVTERELETDLAFLVYGHPERGYTENVPTTMVIQNT